MHSGNVLRRTSRLLRLFTITIAASVLVMGVVFTLTLSIARQHGAERQPAVYLIEQGNLLRTLSNDLLDLADDFVRHVPKSAITPTPSVRQWIDRTFSPKLNAYRMRVNCGQVSDPTCQDALSALYSAAERFSGTLASPARPQTRRAVLRAVLDAAATAERTLREQGLSRFLHETPHPPRFREDS